MEEDENWNNLACVITSKTELPMCVKHLNYILYMSAGTSFYTMALHVHNI